MSLVQSLPDVESDHVVAKNPLVKSVAVVRHKVDLIRTGETSNLIDKSVSNGNQLDFFSCNVLVLKP